MDGILYIVINEKDKTVRTYTNYTEAYGDTLCLHNDDHDHPSFRMYQVKGDRKQATLIGCLRREFGHGTYFFERDL